MRGALILGTVPVDSAAAVTVGTNPFPMDVSIRKALESDAEAISNLVTGWALHYLEDPTLPEAEQFLASLTPSATAERIRSDTTFVVNSSLPAVAVYQRFGFVVKDGPQAASGLTFVPMEYSQSADDSFR